MRIQKNLKVRCCMRDKYFFSVSLLKYFISVLHMNKLKLFALAFRSSFRISQSFSRLPLRRLLFRTRRVFHPANRSWEEIKLVKFDFQTKRNSLCRADEELRSVCVGAAVRHRERSKAGVLQLEILVGELCTVNWFSSCAIIFHKVASLTHELGNDAVERWP